MLKRLTNLGWSQRDIAARLGVHQTTVGRMQRAAGLVPAGHASARRSAKAKRAYRAACANYGVRSLGEVAGLVRRVEAAKRGVLPC